MKKNIFLSLTIIFLAACSNKESYFTEESPVAITSISADSAFPGDVITINGNGFKDKLTTVVIFPDNLLGKVVEATLTQLKVIVPQKQNVSGTLQVKTGYDNYANSPKKFSILPYPAPELVAMSANQGPVETPVVLDGRYLSEIMKVSSLPIDINKTTVWVGDVKAKVDSVSYTKVWFKIPVGIASGTYSISAVRDGMTSNKLDFTVDKFMKFEDSFTRNATEWLDVNPPRGIDNNWQILGGKWKITESATDKFLESSAGSNILLINKSAQTLIDADHGFEVSGLVFVPSATVGLWAGMAFCVQDDKNYYSLRLNGAGTLQLIRMVNGVASAVFSNATQAAKLVGLNYYRLEVVALAPYRFSIRALGIDGNVILSLPSITDTQSRFNGGYGGFYALNSGRYDEFIIRSSKIE